MSMISIWDRITKSVVELNEWKQRRYHPSLFYSFVHLFNQFLYQVRKENNRNNANLIILGTSGSGKFRYSC